MGEGYYSDSNIKRIQRQVSINIVLKAPSHKTKSRPKIFSTLKTKTNEKRL